MESYDTILLGSFYAYPTFQEKFGERLATGKYQLPAQWQSALCKLLLAQLPCEGS